jgi:hypothetical protein
MLLAGSMPSADGSVASNFLARTVLPCSSSMATISASAPFPTVTLDLTSGPPPPQSHVPLPGGGTAPAFAVPPYNQSRFSGLQMSSDAHIDPTESRIIGPTLADTVSAITADPNFTVALAAAITSIIGGGGAGGNNNATATTTSNNTTSNNSNSETQ